MTTSSSGAIIPENQVANLGYTSISGARLAWVSTTTFTVGIGQVRDSTNTIDIIIGSTVVSTNAAFNSIANSAAVTVNIANSGAAGIDTGTIAASKMYSVFAIGDSRGFNSGSAVISLAAPSVGPRLPLGYDSWRYIGSVSTDGATHVRPFIQTGAQALRTVWYDPGTGPSTVGVVIPSSVTTGSTTYKNVGVFTTILPQTALECLISTSLTPNTAGNAVFFAPCTVDGGTTAAVGSMANLSAEVVAHAQLAVLRVPCGVPNAAQIAALANLTVGIVSILVATSEATDALVLTLTGYVDQL